MTIIFLNGPSSSGKTTLAKALQYTLEKPFLHVGIDSIIDWMPAKINDWTGGPAPEGFSWKAGQDDTGAPVQHLQTGLFARQMDAVFRKVVTALARLNHDLIVDDVAEDLSDWRNALKDFDVLWVGVTTPLEVLEQRERRRENRLSGSARGQFHRLNGLSYDLLVDTSKSTPASIAETIKSFISSSEC